MEGYKNIDLKNIDKSNWKPFRFDQIAKNISERVSPKNTDLKIYVGLEHLDSESIHIKRFGKPDDVEGEKLRCYPGDIIFGRRRAYQRKAAIATFDGFCSAHSLVLRANPEVIDPKLFPFFLHSDLFMHRAVDISVGSLSPTINWGTLKTQEFLLPPKDQQAQIAELLWAMDEVIEKHREVLDKLFTLKICNEKLFFTLPDLKPVINSETFFEKVTDGTHDTPQKQSQGYRLLTSKNIKDNRLDYDTDYFVNETDYLEVNKRSKVNVNDILFGMIGTVGQVCRVKEEPDYIIKNMGLFKTNDINKSKVGYYFFKSSLFQHTLASKLLGTTQKYISLGYLRNLKLPDPENTKVIEWIKKEENFDNIIIGVESKISNSKALQKSLINQIF